MPFEDEMGEDLPEGEGDPELEEIASLASAAFPGVDVDPGALKDLIRHCMTDYGSDSAPPAHDPALAIVMGSKPKK